MRELKVSIIIVFLQREKDMYGGRHSTNILYIVIVFMCADVRRRSAYDQCVERCCVPLKLYSYILKLRLVIRRFSLQKNKNQGFSGPYSRYGVKHV